MPPNQLYIQFLEQSNDLIWMIDPNFHLLYANKAYLNSIKEVTGIEMMLNASVLVNGFGEGYIEKWKAYYIRAFKEEFIELKDHFYHPIKKETQYSKITFRPILGENQEILALACQSTDITDIVNKKPEADQMIDASLDVFCAINEAGNFTYVSSAAKTHWGYSPKELIGKPYVSFILEEDILKTNEIAAEILSGKEVKSFVNRYRKKEGGIAYNLWSARWDDNAKLMYCVARDGKEKIEQEELTQQSEQRFKALVQEGSDLIGILDIEGNYTYVSPTSTAILGMAPKEFIGRNAFEFIHPDDVERVSTSLQKVTNQYKVKVEPFRFKNHKKEWRWVETVLTNMLENPAVNGIVANSRDITDKIEQENKIEKSKKRFEALVENSMDCIIIITPEGKTSYVSGSVKNILGYTPAEAMDMDFRELVHPDDLAEAENALANTLQHPGVPMKGYTSRVKHKNGSWRWIEPVITNLLHDPSIQGIVDNFRDITDRIEEERKLKLLESVITNTNDAVLITEAEPVDEPGPRIIYVNDAFTKMTGYTAEEVIGKSPRILQGPNSNAEDLAKLGRALRNWEPYEITTINYKKNGEEFWINFSVTPVADETGWYTHWIAIERDVTEQINKESEKDLITKISGIFNQNNDLITCLSAICKEIAEFGSFDFAEMWLPTIDAKMINHVANYVGSKRGTIFYNTAKNPDSCALGEGIPGYVWKNKKNAVWEDVDDEWRLFKRKVAAKKAGFEAIMGIPIKHKEEVLGVLLLGTERPKTSLAPYMELFKKLKLLIGAELSRKETEIELAQIFNFTPDMICVAGFDGYIKRMNPAGLELLGYSLDEIRSKPIKSFIYDEDRLHTTKMQTRLYNGENLRNFENRYVTKQGKIIWLNWTAISAKEHGMVYAVAKNITEEKNLRELNRLAGKLAKIGSWEMNVNNKTIYWSNEVHQLHETDPNSFQPSIEETKKFYREDFRGLVQSKIEKCISTGEKFDFEAVKITAKKKEIWVRVIGEAEFVNGKCIRIYGSFQDIHDRKEAEIALRQSEAQFRTIFEIATLGIAQVDPRDGRIILVNSYYESITGYSTKEMLKMNFLELTHPEDREKDWELFSKAARGEEEYNNEKRYIKKDGNIVWVRIHLAFIRNETGKPIRTVAICEDITDRKEAELRLQSLADNLPGVVFQYYIYPDGTDRLMSVTQGSKEVWGLTAEEVMQNNQLVWKQIMAGGDIETVQKSISDSVATKSKWSAQWKYVKPTGEIKTHLGYGSPSHLPDGTIVFNSVILDVTEEAKNEELLEQVSKMAKVGSWEVDIAENNVHLSSMAFTILETDPQVYTPDFENSISIYREDFRDIVSAKLKDCIKNGGFIDYEAIIITFENNEKWVRVVANAEMHEGQCKRIYGSIQDINEQKIAALQLGESLKALEDYKFALDQSAIIAVTDKKGVITSVNANFCTISKYKREEIIGQTHRLINAKYHPSEFFTDLWKTIASGKTWRGEIKNKAKDGSYYWVDTTIVPFLNEKNRPFQYLAIRFDITERKKAEQEKHNLQATIENSLNEIYIFDAETFKFSYVNKGALLNLGYSEQEIKALTPLDLKPEFVETSFKELIAPLVNNEKEKIIFFTNHKRKDNSLYPVEVHLQLVAEDHNKRFLAIILDITEHKKAEEENRFKARLLSMVKQAVIATNLDGEVNYWNKGAEMMYGWKPEEALGKNIMQLTTLETNKEEAQQIMEMLKKGNSWSGDFEVQKKDGTNFTIMVTNSPIYDENNNLKGIIGISSDITQEIKNKVLLEQYTKELERSNEELEQFAFVTSHDLQEPLRMISSFMDQLKRKYEDQLDEKALQYIHFATDGAKRMKQIILDLLEYSRANRPTESMEDVDVNEILSEFKQLRRKIISEKSVTISAPVLPTIFSHKAAITQVLHSLLDNAIKYSKKEIDPYIEITATENKDDWKFSIKDNGIGIDSEFFDKIFIIFQRLHNRNEYDGTGIGLSIAKRHVEFLGGKIWLESNPDDGTTFYFTIAKQT